MSAPNLLAAIQSANEVIDIAHAMETPLRGLLPGLRCDTGEARADHELGVRATAIGFITLAAAGVIAAFSPSPARVEALQALLLAKESAERAARLEQH